MFGDSLAALFQQPRNAAQAQYPFGPGDPFGLGGLGLGVGDPAAALQQQMMQQQSPVSWIHATTTTTQKPDEPSKDAEEEILKKGGKKLHSPGSKPIYIIEQGSGVDPEEMAEILDCKVIQVNPGKINSIRELNVEDGKKAEIEQMKREIAMYLRDRKEARRQAKKPCVIKLRAPFLERPSCWALAMAAVVALAISSSWM